MSEANQEPLNLENNYPPTSTKKLENSLKNIYCLSGLGTDDRVFQKLKFQGYQPIHIHWIEPKKGETITAYAQRLTTQIKSDCPILVGLSFGGIIAVEIAKQIATEKVILISSTKNKQEIPFYFKIWRLLPIYLLLPARFILWVSQLLVGWFFSLETIAERKLLKAIIFDVNAKLLKWSIHQIVTWKNELVLENIYHIHGESDRIFPMRFIHEDFTVKHGGHLMIMNQAEHISQLIQKIVNL